MNPVSPEFSAGLKASVGAGLPLCAVSLLPAIARSSAGETHPLRELDAPGMPNFFDHAGNFIDGTVMSLTVVSLGMAADRYIPDDYRRQSIIATTAGGMAFSSAVNVAYETTAVQEVRETRPDAAFDTNDALYGSAAGAIVSLTFCAAALWQRAKLRRKP